jgi:hypothetical protein
LIAISWFSGIFNIFAISKEYHGNSTWRQDDLIKWVSENVHQVSLWLSPTGTKSTALAPYLKQGPVLLFFTPRNFYTDSSDAYEMVCDSDFHKIKNYNHSLFS